MNRSKSSTQGDGSLQHLSAEEQACLTFLEETIESLNTAEQSGLSHDEPAPANLTKGNTEIRFCDPPRNSASNDRKRNYLVPTPFILANGSACVHPKPGAASSSGAPPTGMDGASKSEKLPQNNPAVPQEVNVTEVPPRPLSTEHLLELRKNLSKRASVKTEKQPSSLESSSSYNVGESQNTSEGKPSRPAVAPKPKKLPSHVAVLSQKKSSSRNEDSSLSTSPVNASSKQGHTKETDLKPSTNKGQDTRISTAAAGNQGLTKDERSDWHKSDSASQEDRDVAGRPSARAPQKQPVAPDLSVLMDQSMDEDRREALRKLGLLKN